MVPIGRYKGNLSNSRRLSQNCVSRAPHELSAYLVSLSSLNTHMSQVNAAANVSESQRVTSYSARAGALMEACRRLLMVLRASGAADSGLGTAETACQYVFSALYQSKNEEVCVVLWVSHLGPCP